MSKQSNQRYRKEIEKQLFEKVNNSASKSDKNQTNEYNYMDKEVDAPSNVTKKDQTK